MNSPVVGKRAHTAEFGWQKQSVCVLFLQLCYLAKVTLQGLLSHQGECFMSQRVSTSTWVFHQGTENFQLLLLKQIWLINLCWYADITKLHKEHCSLTKISELHWSYQRVGPSFSNLQEVSSCTATNHRKVHLVAERCSKSPSCTLWFPLNMKHYNFCKKYFRTLLTFKSKSIFFSK